MRIKSLQREVTVYELTNLLKRELIRNRETLSEDDGGFDFMDLQYVGDGIIRADIPHLCDMSVDEWDQTTEAEQDAILAESKRLNARFFAGPLDLMRRAVSARLGNVDTSLSGKSALSSLEDIPEPGSTH